MESKSIKMIVAEEFVKIFDIILNERNQAIKNRKDLLIEFEKLREKNYELKKEVEKSNYTVNTMFEKLNRIGESINDYHDSLDNQNSEEVISFEFSQKLIREIEDVMCMTYVKRENQDA